MSKFLLFVLVSVFICVALLLIILGMGFNKADEVVKLQNQKNGESIFLLKTSWGNDGRMAIGLDDKLKEGFGNVYPEKYNTDYTTAFFYKFLNDTLIVFNGGFKEPKLNKFKTPIKLLEMEGYYFRQLCVNKKYKELGFKVFPESQEYLIENYAK